jgi:hypothetical protein
MTGQVSRSLYQNGYTSVHGGLLHDSYYCDDHYCERRHCKHEDSKNENIDEQQEANDADENSTSFRTAQEAQ